MRDSKREHAGNLNEDTGEMMAEDKQQTPLWDKINDEAEMLRKRTTPVYMKQRIMDALPENPEPAPKPWIKRIFDK